ncbi:MAG: DNA-formamidopyrimidine glycosylase family protein [Vicinamibacterales bacterium]
MPEGDTIFRAARTLNRALAGKTIVRFESALPALTRVPEDAPITGRTVDSVSSMGKHLLMRLSDALVLRTHLRMNGSWHIYRPGERWQRPRRDMRILLATADFEAVGFNIPVAEFIEERHLPRHRELRELGSDLLSEDFDEDETVARIQAHRTTAIGDVLLNQRVLAGIGNVYKSEVLFACRVNPFLAAGSLDAATVHMLVRTARKFLRANVSTALPPMTTYGGFRRTTSRDDPSQRLWVYRRAGKPCRRCDTPIATRKRGPDARSTYWCPGCQGKGSD